MCSTLIVILWSFFFGALMLYVLSSKTVVIVFGFLLGTSVSELSSGAGLISKINATVTEISETVNSIIGDSNLFPHSFICKLVWLSFIILLVCCLPSVFLSEEFEKIDKFDGD
jgi:hypothetical protein